jgi:hypothetical protein
MTGSSIIASRNTTETQDTGFLLLFLPINLTRLLFTYLHPLLGSDEISGEEWQVVTAI